MEGGDISYAYLHGNIDTPILITHPTDSFGVARNTGKVCLLLNSMYGLIQAGIIWGSVLMNDLMDWGFAQSVIDARVLLKRVDEMFVAVIIVVDDMLFVSNSATLLGHLKDKLRSLFDVKIFGKLRYFIGWEITHQTDGIVIAKARYVDTLLAKYGLLSANGAYTPLAANADLMTPHAGDVKLSQDDHSLYRAAVGELVYLAVCTRPDVSFAVSYLVRNVYDPTVRHLWQLKRAALYMR